MARFIDADVLKDEIMGARVIQKPQFLNTEETLMVIDNQPTADVVEVKHGYFKRNERNIPKMREFHEKGIALSMNEKSIFYTCSCCGSWCSLSQNYCSECGAKMNGRRDT